LPGLRRALRRRRASSTGTPISLLLPSSEELPVSENLIAPDLPWHKHRLRKCHQFIFTSLILLGISGSS
jgi:hypothetical protein